MSMAASRTQGQPKWPRQMRRAGWAAATGSKAVGRQYWVKVSGSQDSPAWNKIGLSNRSQIW